MFLLTRRVLWTCSYMHILEQTKDKYFKSTHVTRIYLFNYICLISSNYFNVLFFLIHTQILRSLIQLRPTEQRKDLLGVLLNFTSFEDTEIRKAALKATCQLADSHSMWEEQIEVCSCCSCILHLITKLQLQELPRACMHLFVRDTL